MTYDVIVVGLGPAGIMATLALQEAGLSVVAIDKGQHYEKRDRSNPYDVTNGFGGAGLFSDGKLSFFPAASSLWGNSNSERIRDAYTMLFDVLKNLGYSIPAWQNKWTNTKTLGEYKKGVKRYPSQYFNKQSRDHFVKHIFQKIEKYVILNTEVVRIEKNAEKYTVATTNGIFETSKILLCTGKGGNEIIKRLNFTIPHKCRYEFGFRVETSVENFRPSSLKQIDYKYIEEINDVEFRTFCSCKNGLVLKSKYTDYVSFNGSVSDKPTGLSNIGLTIRCDSKDNPYVQEAVAYLAHNGGVEISYKDGHDWNRDPIYGLYTDKLLAERMSLILKKVRARDKITIYAPEIEYLGEYPAYDCDSFRIHGHNIWIAGDLSAKYRGIIAAMVSGIYAALNINIRERK